MSDLLKITLTAAITVGGGVIVLVVGQIIIRFVIDPIHDLNRAIGEVGNALIYYAHLYMNPKQITSEAGDYSAGSLLPPVYGVERGEASDALRQKAGLLFSRASAVPKYGWLARIGVIPQWESLKIAHKELINLSNSVSKGNPDANAERRRIIAESLLLNIGIYE